jgi:hypothetical protein
MVWKFCWKGAAQVKLRRQIGCWSVGMAARFAWLAAAVRRRGERRRVRRNGRIEGKVLRGDAWWKSEK